MIRVESSKPYKIVYSLFEHEYLGYLFEPHIVQLINNGELSLTHQRLYSITAKEFAALDDIDLKLIKLLEECEQEQIIKKYHKSRLRPSIFFSQHYTPEMHTIIRPNIERRMAQAINLMKHKDVYLMTKEGHPAGRKIIISDQPASVLFHFRRSAESTRYFPTIKYNEEKIEFMFKNAAIICNAPAWLLLNDRLLYFEKELDGKKLQPFLNKRFIEIPRTSEKVYYQKFIIPLIEKYHVYAEGFDIITKQFEARPVLKIANNWNNIAALTLYFNYDKFSFAYKTGNAVSVTLEELNDQFTFYRVKRSLQWESSKVDTLKSMGLLVSDGSTFVLKAENQSESTDYQLYEWLNENLDQLTEAGFEVQQDRPQKEYFIGKSRVDVKISENNDWFDVYAVVFFGTFQVPFISLKNHILNKIKEYVLPNGKIAIIPDAWFVQFSDLFNFTEKGQNLRLRKHHLGLVQELSEEIGIAGNKNKALIDFEEFEESELANNFNGSLRPYQKAGFDWFLQLRKYNFGGCLADDMGLGKTIQTLALLQKVKEEDRKNEIISLPSLLVMPTSLIYNWQKESSKFTPDLKILIYTGTERQNNIVFFNQYDLVLTTYGVVRLDEDKLKTIRFNYIILDESQIIKNPKSKITKAVKSLNSALKLILSGTPIENSVMDLWSQLSFINPGLLGSESFFTQNFLLPIEKQKDQVKAEKLQLIIKPFVLRRTKEQVATELPEKVEHIFYSDMSEEQEKIYEETKSHYRNELLKVIENEGIKHMQINLLAGLNKLRQIANHPLLTDKEYDGSSGKFNDIILNLENTLSKGHKILVFSQFVKHLDIFRTYLDRQKINYAYLDGATKNRQEEVDRFQTQPEIQLFLISLKAGGVGLNLTAADYVFILDPWWNPAVEQQASDRTHRIGQTKNVFVYKFITRNSIEEKILALQARKKHLANSLITIQDSMIKSLTAEDVRGFLT